MKIFQRLASFILFFSTMSSAAPGVAAEGFTERSDSKNQWPHLIGKHSSEVTEIIKSDRPGIEIVTVPNNAFVTMDMNFDRVRLFVDSAGTVTSPPRVG